MTAEPKKISFGEQINRFSQSLSTRLQTMTIFLSAVGVAFGVKGYLHVKEIFGTEASQTFLDDLCIQIIIAVFVNIIVGYIIYQIATKRIITLCEVMRGLTEGNYDTEVPFIERQTEIGSMARKVQIFKENGIKLNQMEHDRVLAEAKAETDRKKLLKKLSDDFNSTVSTIVDAVRSSADHMQSNSKLVSDSATLNNDRIQKLSTESSHASENVNTVAVATEELSASTKEIAKQVNRSTEITKNAVLKAETASDAVNQLSDGAEKIGEVINIINDIAEQINLLALNATIEAARAGDAGKGFAVVASEVKNLASQTAKATEEVASVIRNIQSGTGASVKSIKEISDTIREINDISTSIAAAVDEQDASTQEIAKNAQEAASHTNVVNESLSTILESSLQNGKSATEMLSSCSQLTNNSNNLSGEIENFLKHMRDSS